MRGAGQVGGREANPSLEGAGGGGGGTEAPAWLDSSLESGRRGHSELNGVRR